LLILLETYKMISYHSETIINRSPDLENHENDVLHMKIK